MTPYTHRIQYYETDQMGVTHHSNYIRWMEEARIQFLDEIGWGYDRLEELGILSPVLGVDCKYKEVTHFRDEVVIDVKLVAFRGVRFTIAYEMRKKESGNLVFTGTSEHCFLGKDFKPVRLKKEQPDFYDAFVALVEPVSSNQ